MHCIRKMVGVLRTINNVQNENERKRYIAMTGFKRRYLADFLFTKRLIVYILRVHACVPCMLLLYDSKSWMYHGFLWLLLFSRYEIGFSGILI